MPAPGDERLPHVTVIVPVKDRREQMLRCLDALLALDYPSYDILVADNRSADGTPDACRERAAGSEVDVDVAEFSGSLAAVRNQAGAHARGELLAFTDSDCLPEAAWLRAGVRQFRSNPAIGVVCGRTVPEEPIDGTRWPASRQIEAFSGRYEGCNILFRRDALLATEGFGERLGFFWEDTAAGLAVRDAGWDAGFEPDAVVRHDVTFPGFRWHLGRAWRQARALPVLVEQYPRIRRELFFAHVFQRPRSVLLLLFALGVALAGRSRASLLLALPYLWLRFPRYPHARAALDFAELVAFDAANVGGAFVEGVRRGELVL